VSKCGIFAETFGVFECSCKTCLNWPPDVVKPLDTTCHPGRMYTHKVGTCTYCVCSCIKFISSNVPRISLIFIQLRSFRHLCDSPGPRGNLLHCNQSATRRGFHNRYFVIHKHTFLRYIHATTCIITLLRVAYPSALSNAPAVRSNSESSSTSSSF
jgi:hypothetical protein